eukprot:662027-Pelagomonas_calceolata.AAC.10
MLQACPWPLRAPTCWHAFLNASGTSMAFEGAYTLATHLGRAAAAATEANPVGSAAYKEALQSELTCWVAVVEKERNEGLCKTRTGHVHQGEVCHPRSSRDLHFRKWTFGQSPIHGALAPDFACLLAKQILSSGPAMPAGQEGPWAKLAETSMFGS